MGGGGRGRLHRSASPSLPMPLPAPPFPASLLPVLRAAHCSAAKPLAARAAAGVAVVGFSAVRGAATALSTAAACSSACATTSSSRRQRSPTDTAPLREASKLEQQARCEHEAGVAEQHGRERKRELTPGGAGPGAGEGAGWHERVGGARDEQRKEREEGVELLGLVARARDARKVLAVPGQQRRERRGKAVRGRQRRRRVVGRRQRAAQRRQQHDAEPAQQREQEDWPGGVGRARETFHPNSLSPAKEDHSGPCDDKIVLILSNRAPLQKARAVTPDRETVPSFPFFA